MNQISKDDVKQIIETARNVSPNSMEYTLADPQNGKNVIAKIQLKTNLTVDEKSAFVSRVVNGMFDDDGHYMPWFLDPLFMITLVQMTTNVPVFKRKHIDNDGKKIDVVDVEKTYELAKALNLGNVPNESYHMLVAELQGMIRESIEYQKQMNVRKSESVLTHLQEALESILNSIDQIIENENVKQLIDTLQSEKQSITDGSNVVPFPEVKQDGN